MVDSLSRSNHPLPHQAIELQVKLCPEKLRVSYSEEMRKLQLRAGSADAEMMDILADRLGFVLPDMGETVVHGDSIVLASGPGEWLIKTTGTYFDKFQSEMGRLCEEGYYLSCIDMSSATCCIRIEGRDAAARIFSIATETNLGVDSFPTGACSRIRFSQCDVLVHRTDEGAYDLHVPRSYAEWIWNWLQAVA